MIETTGGECVHKMYVVFFLLLYTRYSYSANITTTQFLQAASRTFFTWLSCKHSGPCWERIVFVDNDVVLELHVYGPTLIG